MSTAVMTRKLELKPSGEKALKAAAGFWLAVAVIGQWAFFAYLVAFYGPSTFTGHYEVWTRNSALNMSYVPGDTAGNLAFASHALLAAVIAFGGAIQLIPQIRNRFLWLHRWIGRAFFTTALGLSASGLYMEWVRGDRFNMLNAVAITINAVLIISFCILAWRFAARREVSTHRRWAMRAYVVANAQWFTRVGLFAWIVINRGPVGIGPNFDGPFISFLDFGCYLVPLAVLELYLYAKDSPGALRRMATAGLLFVLTLAMGAGIAGFSGVTWGILARLYDSRTSIADTLSATIASNGLDQAIKQYHELKASPAPSTYNFDEAELDDLGYRLIRVKKFKDAIRIFQLNVEAYPKSSNVYDSLAEAYMATKRKLSLTTKSRSRSTRRTWTPSRCLKN
jgi:uncharacterized membrane protein